MVGLGDTVLLKKPSQDNEHLWVLLTAPAPQSFEVIIVNITGRQAHSDTTTLLAIGDHAFITKPSVIYYADARVTDSRLIDEALAKGLAGSHRQCSRVLLSRIQGGLLTSPHTTPKIKAAFEAASKLGRT